MSDPMQGILAEAKSNKYSLIKDKLSEDGEFSVNPEVCWKDTLCLYQIRKMLRKKNNDIV